MRILSGVLATVSAFALAAPALAQDAAPTEPAPAFTVTGGATVTSDYRFRGISQTNKRFAVQGTLGVAHESGFYVGAWGSSIDDYVAAGSDQEIDIYGGYKKTFNGTTVDGGLLYYYYPGSGGLNTDFFEPYVNLSHTFGPVGVKVGANYAWKQHAIAIVNERDDNLYTYGELTGGIPGTGVTLTGHLGHSFGRSFLTGGYKGYTDWSVNAAYTWKALTFSVAYVDTNKRFQSGGPFFGIPFPSAKDRNIGNANVVGAISVAF